MAQAAEDAGLDHRLAASLDASYGNLKPWPEAVPILGTLAAAGLKLGVVTNCSRRLGRIAAGRIDANFDCVVTAEDAGWYKPDPRPYQQALRELGVAADRCLFVAGSSYDLIGTARVGLATYWHDRIGMAAPREAPPPLAHARTLAGLPGCLGIGAADRDCQTTHRTTRQAREP